MRFWDPRSANAQVASFNVRERVYKLDVTGNTMVIAMAGRLFDVYDVRKTSGQPTQEREGSLKFLTRSMGCMPDGQGALLLLDTLANVLIVRCRLCGWVCRRSNIRRILRRES